MTASTIYFLLPEIVLIAAAVLIYIAGAFFQTQKAWPWIALTGIILAMVCLSRQNGVADSGVLQSDGFSLYLRWLNLASGLLLVLLNFRPLIKGGTQEAIGSLLLAIAGGMLVVSANDLILLFIALELISIPTYILLYLGPGDVGCQESAAKYFFLSVLASAILLYGFSFIYGIAGTMNLHGIRIALASLPDMPKGFDNLAKLALALTFAGLCFRLAAVPFHFYAPDVYQGTTNSNAALLSVIPKAAGLAVLVRLVWAAMSNMGPFAWQITMAVSILTMTLGNTMALWQDNPRRMMAYSSIAHAGYLLIGLAAALAMRNDPSPGPWYGIEAMLFYLCVYAIATLGTFAVLELLGQPSRRIESIDELAGLGRTRPAAAAMMAVFMFSLTGIPPLAGFWGKLQIFGSALCVFDGAGQHLHSWFTGLAIVGVLNAAISAGYYLRIVGVMYFRATSAASRAEGGFGVWTAAVACALVTVFIGFYPRPLVKASNQARPVISQTPKIEKTLEIGEFRNPFNVSLYADYAFSV
jgi:NADH-quinone oxidoreductase subunit N